MKHGNITSISAPRITPVLYLDLDIANAGTPSEGSVFSASSEFRDGLKKFPALKSLRLTDEGPAGHPVYRIEGPLPSLIGWLEDGYGAGTHGETVAFYLCEAKLAQ